VAVPDDVTADGPDTRRTLRLPGGEVVTIRASGADTGGAVFAVDAILPPGLTGPPRHRHRAQTETFTVVDGRLSVVVGREEHVLGEGETAVVAPSVSHTFSNPFAEPARIRMAETPAGPLEQQFRALATSSGLVLLRRLAVINVEHDLSFSLTGLPGSVQRPLWRLLASPGFRRRR
jgi:mannose-6-phosphate isomerase-like protein (cupin superfamily)